ncbi:phosphatidylinositol binding clathrin assembly protein a isoform X1 [Pangasianodon hypophthalmus]|uniref:phosphatidylinositol binding clathrin assembly protein a isoform X1 n=1 Tax=Pangasianodon hypophthalmus TaxID=310915 RepID=UPI00148008AE|nr:phosphatidylinositol binding clathrin assembly protein a isoform X1 [Pangasianodon hypophthalmus]XP_053097145.1 phosphatidylinositol binding clathrin assembly protein a isoform X1 [Pangasianodon hypophthalmus]XP_053097146.1 phosphatidylinositol binding clathrin assembly protein a isoform X1 [Pangasianodon hypophthalmus]
MSGQSITDRITAAQHSVTGSAVSKTVCKATTHEVMGPKKKHLDYLIQCTNEMNVNIPQLADTLFERTTNTSWVVVFKSLITTHHLMVYGNERFIQYLASRNTLFNLSNFLDKSGLQGYDMSTFIRRYSRYLNEKAVSYRQVAFDFTKVKRGADGVMRTMNTEKLLKTLPIVQNQMDSLLDFNVNANELTNGVINAAFMLLFKDAIRLFAAYNEGIINLLEKYFDMKKAQCKEGLDIYKKFLTRMTRISEFLKVAEQVGIDRGDIPDLSQAPSSLLDALEQHLASLEGKKVKDSTAASRASTLSNAVSSLANTGISFTKVDEREKQAALEEEQARLRTLKEQRLKELSKKPSTSSTTAASPVSTASGSISTAPAIDLFSTPSSTNGAAKVPNDLLDLQPAFQPSLALPTALPVANTWGDPFTSSESVDDSIPNLNPFLSKPVDAVPPPPLSSDAVSFPSRTPSHEMFSDHYNPFLDSSSSVACTLEPCTRIEGFLSDSFCSPAPYSNTPLFHSEPSAVAGLFGGFTASPIPQPASSSGLNVDFDSVFGNKSTANSTDAADDVLGGILKPTVASPSQSMPPSAQQPGKLVSDDLDSSLANLVGNLGIGNGTTKNDIHWSQPGEKKLTGGTNWQPKTAPTTTWNPASMNGMHFPQYAPSVMAFPATTPTGMMGYAMPAQMVPVTMMTQPTMMYTQPVMRPANPFGPISGAQPSAASSPSSQSPLRPPGQDPFAQLSLKEFL